MEARILWQSEEFWVLAGLAGESLWRTILQTACQDHGKQRSGRYDHQHSEQGRRKVRLWQAVCSLVSFVPPGDSKDTIFAMFDMLSVGHHLPSPTCTLPLRFSPSQKLKYGRNWGCRMAKNHKLIPTRAKFLSSMQACIGRPKSSTSDSPIVKSSSAKSP